MITDLPTTSMRVLTREQCLERLAAGRFGRVVVALPSGAPVIRPVNYLFDRGSQSVLIRTGAGSKLFALLHSEQATFEIDEVDPSTQTGWSVIVTGVVEDLTDRPELTRVSQLGLKSWAESEDMRWLRIRAFTVSGREIALDA